jgi:DNA-directed RNA polymerase subunit N (RpoN/RPB10)|uniref:DNA-directed RNA polymerase n=1 Tax=viral metagenome TaxID=1070528 RepID=A0A6C0EAZ7_9ZZZZ
MLVPVRCFSCNKVIGDKWETFNRRLREELFKNDISLEEYENQFIDLSIPEFTKTVAGKILDELGLIRYCCRTNLKSCIDLSEEISY